MNRRGLILVFTGDGKGKTTAAFGAALRTLGRGGRVGVVQFFKSTRSKAQSSKKVSSLRFVPCPLRSQNSSGEIEASKQFGHRMKVWSFGGGFTWQVAREVNQKAADQAWKKCRELLRDPKFDLVILDEIHIAIRYKFLKVAHVLKALKTKPASQHVILTGRGAPKSLLKCADLVTEMKCLKHPFSRGILAQSGIDF